MSQPEMMQAPSPEYLQQLLKAKTHNKSIDKLMMLFGDKYSFYIVDLLANNGAMRFVALEAQIAGISPRTLSQRLKHLEQFGLIKRHQYATIPPRVDYELTEKATSLKPMLDELKVWVETWFPNIES